MKALLILGMHRSGTSALAGQCASQGFWFGDRLLPPRPDNAKGYYEDIDVMLVNDQLVTLLFGAWYSPVTWTEVECTFPVDHPRVNELQESLRDALQRLNASGSTWAVKDPRLSRLLPIWWPLVQSMDVEPGIIMALRRPSEVVASLDERDSVGVTTARLLWLRHVAEPLAYALAHRLQIAILPYDDLLRSPERLGDRLSALGFHGEQRGDVFVDQALRHHQHTTEPSGDALAEMCETLYQKVVSIPVFGSNTAKPDLREAIYAACGLPVGAYLDRLYLEAMGIATVAQRLSRESRKLKQQTQQQALRQRIRNAERKLAESRIEISRLKRAKEANPASKPKR